MSIRTVPDGGSTYRTLRRIPWWAALDVTLGALAVAAVAGFVLADRPLPVRLAAAWWAAFALVLCRFDVRTHRLPLPLTAAMAAGTLLLLSLADAHRLGRAVAAGGVLAAVLFLLCLPRRGIGLGDAALVFPIGLALGWAGWPAVLLWPLATSLIMSVCALALLVTRRVGWRSALPLGPFLLLGVVPAIGLS